MEKTKYLFFTIVILMMAKVGLCVSLLILLLTACGKKEARSKSPNMIAKIIIQDSLVFNTISQNRVDVAIKTEMIEIDTLSEIIQLREDITLLLKTKDIDLISDHIFGDCIYFYLSINEGGKITKNDIIISFNKIFNSEISKAVYDNKLKEHISFHVEGKEGITYINRYEGQNPIYVCLSISTLNSEFDSSKLYWFLRRDKHWIFCGLTCTG